MKKSLLFLLASLLGFGVFSQVKLPNLSPRANLETTVGMTKINIKYSSPGVRGREIWGKLVPFDKVWRAGANEPTTLEFSTDVQIGGKNLSAGKYAFFIVPKPGKSWTAIVNSDHKQWGAYRYSEEKDLVRLEVEPQDLAENVEHLRYAVENHGLESGAISLLWEKKKVLVPFSVETQKLALANIQSALDTAKQEKLGGIRAAAAEFHLGNLLDPAAALRHSTEAARLQGNVHAQWLHARVLAWNGRHEEALATLPKLEEASKTDKNEAFYYKQILPEVNALAVKSVIALDDSLGRLRNHACERISLSQTIQEYADGLGKIAFRDCPPAFAEGFRKHREAWLALMPITDRYPDLRGEMHDLFKELESGKDGGRFKPLVKTVWDTWGEIEAAMK